MFKITYNVMGPNFESPTLLPAPRQSPPKGKQTIIKSGKFRSLQMISNTPQLSKF